jgi:hypothetical protein
MRGRRSLTALVGMLVAFACLPACGMSHVSTVSTPGAKVSVRTIAIMPGGGLLADAVAVELMNRGFTIIDAASTSNMMIRLNLNEVEIARPEGLAKFKGQGVEALLVVRGAGGYDQQPQSASARTAGEMAWGAFGQYQLAIEDQLAVIKGRPSGCPSCVFEGREAPSSSSVPCPARTSRLPHLKNATANSLVS